MDKLSVQQKSPKEEKAAAHRSGTGKKGKKSKGARNDEQHKQPQMKVVYISNPMRVTTTASEFKDRVQELTGRHADIADLFFNSSSEPNCCSSAGPSSSPATTTTEYYSPSSSSSHDDLIVPSASTGGLMAEPADPPVAIHHQDDLLGHPHQDRWRDGGQTGHSDDAPFFTQFADGADHYNYYPNTFEPHLLGNHPQASAAGGMQPPTVRRFESPLADVLRRLADGRP